MVAQVLVVQELWQDHMGSMLAEQEQKRLQIRTAASAGGGGVGDDDGGGDEAWPLIVRNNLSSTFTLHASLCQVTILVTCHESGISDDINMPELTQWRVACAQKLCAAAAAAGVGAAGAAAASDASDAAASAGAAVGPAGLEVAAEAGGSVAAPAPGGCSIKLDQFTVQAARFTVPVIACMSMSSQQGIQKDS